MLKFLQPCIFTAEAATAAGSAGERAGVDHVRATGCGDPGGTYMNVCTYIVKKYKLIGTFHYTVVSPQGTGRRDPRPTVPPARLVPGWWTVRRAAPVMTVCRLIHRGIYHSS